jgi:hypothetical protein
MKKKARINVGELELRLQVTFEQALLLARSCREAESVANPDVFLRAHIASLYSDIEKLRLEYCEIQRLGREAGVLLSHSRMDQQSCRSADSWAVQLDRERASEAMFGP